MSAVPYFSNLFNRLTSVKNANHGHFFIRLEIIDFDKTICKEKNERLGNLYSLFLSHSVTHHRGPIFLVLRIFSRDEDFF